MNQRNILITGSLLCGLSVALGAFGAHALKPMLAANQRVDVYETAVRYQFFHGLALLVGGMLIAQLQNEKYIRWATSCWTVGTLLFSGSLYVLCFVSIGSIGILTPIGGILLLAGWTLLITGVFKQSKTA